MKKKDRQRKGEGHPAWKGGMRRANLRRQLRRTGVKFTEEILAIHESITHCEICGIELEAGKGARSKHFDHNHATQEYRGTLCGTCNLSMGMAHDEAKLLREMADYLDAHNGHGKTQIGHEEKRS